MENNEKVLLRIQKLLNLSNGNANENEAKAALMMAQKMMMEHNIEATDVPEMEDAAPDVNYGETDFLKKIMWYHSKLARIIAKNFRCKHVLWKYKKMGTTIRFFGTSSDGALAKEVFFYANVAIAYLSDRFARNEYSKGVPMKGLRASFIDGFLTGLEAQYNEQVATNNWLALIEVHPAVIDHMSTLGLTTRTVSNNIHFSQLAHNYAHAAGEKEGRSFSVEYDRLQD